MPRLNAVVLRDLIEQKGLRFWWLAEQLGINRRTLNRWLSGSTRAVSAASIEQLADILGCSAQNLTLSAPVVLATPLDQLKAARALITNRTMDELLVGHRFKEFETLAKGLLVHGLTQSDLGELYQRIASVLMRQSKLEECRQYAQLAYDIADQTSNERLRLRSRMLLSFSTYVAGDAKECLRLDRLNLQQARRLNETWQIAANLSNLADQYLDFGRYSRSIKLQRMAIAQYTKLDSATSLTFCHLGLAQLYRQTNDVVQVQREIAQASDYVERVGFKRGKADVALARALLCSDGGAHTKAIAELAVALAAYSALDIEEARVFRHAALIYRRAGEVGEAQKMLSQGFDAVAKSGVVIEAGHLLCEQSQSLLESNPQVAADKLAEARAIFLRAGYLHLVAQIDVPLCPAAN